MSVRGFVERLQTIAVTATLTSAVWIVLGTVYLDRREPRQPSPSPVTAEERASARPATALSGQLVIPVAGVAPGALTDTFSQSRGGRRHEAIDIIAPAGTPVIAAAAGVVEKLFRSDAGGNTVYVRSTDRQTVYYYAHLQGYARGLAEGQAVRQRQQLGTVGSSGNADPAGPHLHFAVLRTAPDEPWWQAAAAVNPYPLLAPR